MQQSGQIVIVKRLY